MPESACATPASKKLFQDLNAKADDHQDLSAMVGAPSHQLTD